MIETVSSRLDRVRNHTTGEINNRIDNEIESHIRNYAIRSPGEISLHLEESGMRMGYRTQSESQCLLNNLSRHCPCSLRKCMVSSHSRHYKCISIPTRPAALVPAADVRAVGKRTKSEIDVEKFALKALRGNFRTVRYDLGQTELSNSIIDAVRC